MPHQRVCASRRDQVGTSPQRPFQFCFLYIINHYMDYYGYVYSVRPALRRRSRLGMDTKHLAGG